MKNVKLKYPRLLGFVMLMLTSLGFGSLLATVGFSLLLVVLAGLLLAHYMWPSSMGCAFFISFVVVPVVFFGVILIILWWCLDAAEGFRGFRDPYGLILILISTMVGVAVLIGFATQVRIVAGEDHQ